MRPGLLTSPNTKTLRFINSTVTTGSFIRFSLISRSLMYPASSERVIPATRIFPKTGNSIYPWESTVYTDISWLEFCAPDANPARKEAIGKLNKLANWGSLLLTTIESLSSGRNVIWVDAINCSDIPGLRSWKYTTFLDESHELKSTITSKIPNICLICITLIIIILFILF